MVGPGRDRRRTRSTRIARASALAATALVVAGAAMLVPGATSAMGSARASATAAHGTLPPRGPCPPRTTTAAYTASVARAAASGRDVWGEQLLAAPDGPTYEAATRLISPLLFGQQRKHEPLTNSGVYYLAFGYPLSPNSKSAVMLHVADGSEIIARWVWSRRLTVKVGRYGRETYGTCLAWLTPATLAAGYLPIMHTAYSDESRVAYEQESFVGRLPGVQSVVSLVRLEVDTTRSRSGAVVRFVPSVKGHAIGGDRFGTADGTILVVGSGAAWDGKGFRYHVPAGRRTTLYAQWLIRPAHIPRTHADARTYDAARAQVAAFWRSRLAAGAGMSVPEPRIQQALQAMLIQQMVHRWRYSLGNYYEELSYAEGTDTAEVMTEYGFADIAENILRFSKTRLPRRYTSWRAAERLMAEATYYALSHDRRMLEEDEGLLTWAVAEIERHQIQSGPDTGRLQPERLSSDVYELVDSTTTQLVAWQGLFAMQRVWAATGHPRLAAHAGTIARRLERALRPDVARALVRLADGSVFLPAALSASEAPYPMLWADPEGSYWNLVVPYALATGFIRPGTPAADGIVRYLLLHGSRLLGVTRADAHVVYSRDSQGLTSGLGMIYGLAASRFLADNDEPDQLVLSLYGMLAAGMTRDTYVSGEAVSVVPLGTTYYRKTFFPPNSGANSAFLETLRLLLVHERQGARGQARGLDLAFSTPRRWLRDGRTIGVTRVPTTFGPLSYTIARTGSTVRVHASLPPRSLSTRLRLRLPHGWQVTRVKASAGHVRVDRAHATIDLGARRGTVDLLVSIGRSGS